MDIFFKCKCGRQQSFAPSNKPGGITQQEAESVGWALIDGKWVCPICNPELAKRDIEIKVQDNRGVKTSIGKYRTSVKNCVLCVDVENYDLSNVLFIHIEFKAKVPRKVAKNESLSTM